jgi:hypothetical protein
MKTTCGQTGVCFEDKCADVKNTHKIILGGFNIGHWRHGFLFAALNAKQRQLSMFLIITLAKRKIY